MPALPRDEDGNIMDLWMGPGMTYNPPANPTAAGTTATSANPQNLMGTTTGAGAFDTTYSSDYGPSVSNYTPAASPTVNAGDMTQGAQAAQASTTNTGLTSNGTRTTSQGVAADPGTTVTMGGGTDGTTTATPTTTSPAATASPFTGDPTGLKALTAAPTIDDYITNVLGGKNQDILDADGTSMDAILRAHPDVYSAFFNEFNGPNNDKNSTAWQNRVGGETPENYAQYWYDSMGGKANGAPVTGTTTPPPAGNPGTTDPAGSPDGGVGIGGTTGATTGSKLDALNQAIARAKLAVMGRGLNWDNYSNLFTPFYQDIYNEIPDSDTNPEAWFDPNAANTILSGEQTKEEAQARQQALGLTTHADGHLLDPVIQKILDQQTQSGTDLLNNGLKRGQYNEQGFQGGMDALNRAKEAARAKLSGYASDLTSKYNDQLQGISTSALNAASGLQVGDTYNFGDYQNQDNDILSQISQLGEGDLYNLMGTDPLINLSDIRMSAGTSQGAINLNDLDVLDALANRKNANAVGRGLGSEGSF